ncbi:MAG: helix-turn-helix domain-containing protein [Phycisphaerales bacterium]
MTTTPHPPAPDDRILFKITEVAEATSLSTRSIWRLIAQGELTIVRCNRAVRVTRESVIHFCKKGGTKR